MSKKPVRTSYRLPVPWVGLGTIVIIALLTLGNAAANMMPYHIPTTHELQQEEQREIIETRRARLDALLAEGDHCRMQIAREIARAIVYDGLSARTYADDYERRCGEDPIVRRWGDVNLD